jgi:hypothetical protein
MPYYYKVDLFFVRLYELAVNRGVGGFQVDVYIVTLVLGFTLFDFSKVIRRSPLYTAIAFANIPVAPARQR